MDGNYLNNKEKYLEYLNSWIKYIIRTQGWKRYDDLHIDEIDKIFKNSELWRGWQFISI